MQCSASSLGHFTPRENAPGAKCIGRWPGPTENRKIYDFVAYLLTILTVLSWCQLRVTNLWLSGITELNKTGNLLKRVRVNVVAVEKAINITYSECVFVALIIQHTKHTHRTILSSVAWLALPHFSTLPQSRHDFRENVVDHKTCVLISYTTFVWNISHSKKNWEGYYHRCA
jgi:hypothetical protein